MFLKIVQQRANIAFIVFPQWELTESWWNRRDVKLLVWVFSSFLLLQEETKVEQQF